MVSIFILSTLLVAAASVCAIPVPAGTALPVPEVNDSLVKPLAVRGVVSHKTRPHHPILPVLPKLSARDVVSVKHQSTGSDKGHATSKTRVSDSKIANPPAINESPLPSGSIGATTDAGIHSHSPSSSHTRHAHPRRSTTDTAGIPSLDASVGASTHSGAHLSSAASDPSAQTKAHDALSIGLGTPGADIIAHPSRAGTNALLDTNDSVDVGTIRNRVALSSTTGTHDSVGIASNTGTKLHPTVDAASPPLDLGASVLADVKSNTNALDTNDHSKGQGHGSSCGHS
ncbi:hypothetical protein BS47DRAFT_1358623 [Hydnum rufescens UP504]|uniref:Uncharacterized protein n=1 Tax=Hydnum rufescens UP504 TaxID=1448309 RepID=A0A9P6E168_9AGAM|nr:hypothetical protein BS47DRAFT_1358623 [Hydnum rufescens UP504]